MKRITLSVLVMLLSSCSLFLSDEEKKEKAEKEGNALISIKSKLLKGAGEALKTDGKDAVEVATEGVGEVAKALTTGFDKSLSQAKIVADSTFLKTFEIGRSEKFYNDTVKKITVYLIANKAFDKKIKLKAFDQEKKEIGRSVKNVVIDADGAKYIDFEFDKRMPMLQASYFEISHN